MVCVGLIKVYVLIFANAQQPLNTTQYPKPMLKTGLRSMPLTYAV